MRLISLPDRIPASNRGRRLFIEREPRRQSLAATPLYRRPRHSSAPAQGTSSMQTNIVHRQPRIPSTPVSSVFVVLLGLATVGITVNIARTPRRGPGSANRPTRPSWTDHDVLAGSVRGQLRCPVPPDRMQPVVRSRLGRPRAGRKPACRGPVRPGDADFPPRSAQPSSQSPSAPHRLECRRNGRRYGDPGARKKTWP